MTLGKMVHVHEFKNALQAMDAMCSDVGEIISRALSEKGCAHLVLSGGNSPAQYLPLLAGKLEDWSGVWVTLSDERWVHRSHEESNQRMIEKAFIAHAPGAKLMPMMGQGKNVETDADTASQDYAGLPWPADVSILGVGPDGHVASLFPGGGGEGQQQQRVIATTSGEGKKRLSMSLSTLLSSNVLYVFSCGDEKKAVVRQACEDGPFGELPLRALMHQDEAHIEVLMC